MMEFGQEFVYISLCSLPHPISRYSDRGTLPNLCEWGQGQVIYTIISKHQLQVSPTFRRKEEPLMSMKVYSVKEESSRPMKIYGRKKEHISLCWIRR